MGGDSMRVKKRTIAAALSLAMMLGLAPAGIPQAGTPFSVIAQAAKKKTVKKKKKVKKKYKENPRLSKTRLSIRNKKTATVKVSGTKKGISVTSSDKSIATVSRSGKFAFRVRAAKKKKGAAVIRVKTSRGYKYLFVQVGGRTNMSQKTRAWAQAGGFFFNCKSAVLVLFEVAPIQVFMKRAKHSPTFHVVSIN